MMKYRGFISPNTYVIAQAINELTAQVRQVNMYLETMAKTHEGNLAAFEEGYAYGRLQRSSDYGKVSKRV